MNTFICTILTLLPAVCGFSRMATDQPALRTAPPTEIPPRDQTIIHGSMPSWTKYPKTFARHDVLTRWPTRETRTNLVKTTREIATGTVKWVKNSPTFFENVTPKHIPFQNKVFKDKGLNEEVTPIIIYVQQGSNTYILGVIIIIVLACIFVMGFTVISMKSFMSSMENAIRQKAYKTTLTSLPWNYQVKEDLKTNCNV